MLNPDHVDQNLKMVGTALIAVMFALVGALGLIYTGPLGWLALLGFLFCLFSMRKDH